MGRKVIAFWLSLAMVLSFIVVLDVIIDFTPPVKGGIIRYVNETGTGGAFTSIQDAINASNDGDTVFVYNGTYYENVVVNKTINLTGESRGSTIIDGGGFGNVVYVNVNWVNISGFTVKNSGSSEPDAGIKLSSSNNNITDNTIISNEWGIYLFSSSNNTITFNILSSNNGIGIRLWLSLNNKIIGNNITLNDWGIDLGSSSNNIILNNNISNKWYGIRLTSSLNNTIANNSFVNDGINIWGDQLSHYNSHNIPTNNFVNGKSLYYYKDCSGIDIDGIHIGQLIIANCTDIEVRNLQINNTDVGIEVAYTTNTNISGNIISSNDDDGIHFAYSSNNTIINNNISNDQNGIYFLYSSNNTINGNEISSNDNDGIHFVSSSNNNIISNNFSSNNFGIYISQSSEDKIIGNTFLSNNFRGIDIDYSSNINIKENSITLSTWSGISLHFSPNNNVTNNNISDNKDGIYLSSSSKNTISGNNISLNTNDGIEFQSSPNNEVTDNNISNNAYGIFLESSSYNVITNNIISNNGQEGINFDSSSNNIITNNKLLSNKADGLHLYWSLDNSIIKNNISKNRWGIYLGGASNNIITGNNISNNEFGFHMGSASDNIITNNNVLLNSDFGFYLISSSNNRIYHNNIIGNINQALDDRWDNSWDDDYPSGGNYWSDYVGIDNFKGPNQDIPGGDGIGDTNYSIDSNSIDNYPLMEPYQNYNILKKGWNLISISLIQQEQNLTEVLEMVDGYYDAVQWYDNTDPNDPWKHYKVGKPFGNDLTEINEKMGFWIHITQPGDTIFLYNGTQPTSNQTVTFHPGWNLVGYPSLTSYNRTEGLNNITFDTHVDSIWTYDAATQKWKEIGPSDYFELGKGYWIHAKIKCEWEVPL